MYEMFAMKAGMTLAAAGILALVSLAVPEIGRAVHAYGVLPVLTLAAGLVNRVSGAKPGDKRHVDPVDFTDPQLAMKRVAAMVGTPEAEAAAQANQKLTCGLLVAQAVLTGLMKAADFTKKQVKKKLDERREAAGVR